MIGQAEVIAIVGGLPAETLQRWIDFGWVLPRDDNSDPQFDPTDVARVQLIYELHFDLQIEEGSLPVVLSLLDQLYAARRTIRAFSAAVEQQPDDVRAAIISQIALAKTVRQ